MQLNGEHNVVEGLDIFHKVGRAVAHDEIIPFKVKNRRLIVNKEKSEIHGNVVPLTFVKVRCVD